MVTEPPGRTGPAYSVDYYGYVRVNSVDQWLQSHLVGQAWPIVLIITGM